MMLRGISLSVLAVVTSTGALQASLIGEETVSTDVDAPLGIQIAAAEGEGWGSKPIYSLPKLPAGYKYAFGEQRHNPNRGERSLDGRAAMNRIWTEESPQKLIHPSARNVGLTVKGYSPATSEGSRFVQAGRYGDRDAATQAARRLQRHGLPVMIQQVDAGDGHVVLVGPFIDPRQAQAALGKVQRAGFTGATTR